MTDTATIPAEVEFPVDDRPSRLDRRPPSPVGSFDPDDITRVDDKVAEFWERYPDGAIDASDIEQIGESAWRVTAFVWRVAPQAQFHPSARADSAASATRTLDVDGHESGRHPLETAQSIAIGRALRFLGVTGSVTNG